LSFVFHDVCAHDFQVESLKSKIEEVRNSKKGKSIGSLTAKRGDVGGIRGPPSFKVRRLLKGHFGKVYALHWSGDSQNIVSASQDGKLIVWNSNTTTKMNAIPLRSSWVMTCAYEQSKGNLVACGGLDNLCSIYNITEGTQAKSVKELATHDGYISCCRFIDEKNIITSSGDSSCIFWDIERGDALTTFTGHGGDVMSISLSPKDKNVFVSSSIDGTAKIWDIRESRCVQTHSGHTADVNAVSFFPDGNAIGTGSDDRTCRIFDMRAYGEVNCFLSSGTSGVTSVDFSKSGRILFSAYNDTYMAAWDTIKTKAPLAFQMQQAHTDKVSTLGVSPDGDGLCSGSWDAYVKIWA